MHDVVFHQTDDPDVAIVEERMGGELVLEESDGLGAQFTLRLPAAPVVARTLSPATS